MQLFGFVPVHFFCYHLNVINFKQNHPRKTHTYTQIQRARKTHTSYLENKTKTMVRVAEHPYRLNRPGFRADKNSRKQSAGRMEMSNICIDG